MRLIPTLLASVSLTVVTTGCATTRVRVDEREVARTAELIPTESERLTLAVEEPVDAKSLQVAVRVASGRTCREVWHRRIERRSVTVKVGRATRDARLPRGATIEDADLDLEELSSEELPTRTRDENGELKPCGPAAPVSGATVTFRGPYGVKSSASTDADGRAVFDSGQLKRDLFDQGLIGGGDGAYFLFVEGHESDGENTAALRPLHAAWKLRLDEKRTEQRERALDGEVESGRCSDANHAATQSALQRVTMMFERASSSDVFKFISANTVVATRDGVTLPFRSGAGELHVIVMGVGPVGIEATDPNGYALQNVSPWVAIAQTTGLNAASRSFQAVPGSYTFRVTGKGCAVIAAFLKLH